jgi:hypothetical protein
MAFDLSEVWIAETETRLGARLPEDYRAAMMRRNGGGIVLDGEDWELYPIRDGSDRKRIARTANDILRETAACREWRGFPPAALAIAGNGDGDQLVFLRAGDGCAPTVFRWLHETGELAEVAAGFGAP